MKDNPIILAVDQNLSNLELLTQFLCKQGYAILTAESLEAFEQALSQSDDIGLALVDISILNSKIWKRLRELEIPMLVVAEKTELNEWQFMLAAGTLDHIIKPFDPGELLSRVRSLLDLRMEVDHSQLFTQALAAMSHHLTARHRQMLNNLVFHDVLTGVANRRYFDECLSREWKRAARDEKPLALVFIDVDSFQIFNESYSYQEGDECLQKVAKALSLAAKRPADLVARYGAGEFVAILPETDSKGAMFVAETMRSKIANLKIPHAYSSFSDRVSITLGIAVTIPVISFHPEILITGADNALFEAKQEGSDRLKLIELSCY